MIISDFTKFPEENFHQYIWRMDELIQSGKYANWTEITPFVNAELFQDDEEKYRDESAYRKGVKYARDYFEAGVFGKNETEYFKELQLQKQEIRKEKQKLFDERVSLNKLLREQARKESFYEMMKRAISESVSNSYDYSPIHIPDSNCDLIVHFTDPHAGVCTYSSFNYFDSNILRDRINKYLYEIKRIVEEQHPENCYFICGGDMISGLIHVNSRIENKENVVEQIKLISELTTFFIFELSKLFNMVHVYSTPGNHSRATANKDEHIKGENFDALIPYYVSLALNNIPNVKVYNNTLDEGICTFQVRGHNVFGVHGDKDPVSSVVYNMTKLARKANVGLPDLIFLGHRHTNGLTTIDDVKVVESGCIDGMDNYSIDKRLVGSPEQMVVTVTENKIIKCLYDVKLD